MHFRLLCLLLDVVIVFVQKYLSNTIFYVREDISFLCALPL